MLRICISHLYPITLLCLIVGRGQIPNFGNKSLKFTSLLYENDLKIPPPPILRNVVNFPSRAFYSTFDPPFPTIKHESVTISGHLNDLN